METQTTPKPEVKMIVNIIRHGARTPTEMRPEFEKYFATSDPGKLTYNGFRQMVMLGRVLRNRYINSKSKEYANLIDIEKIREQFLLISSPNPRAIESGIAYSLGLFPEYVYKLYDVNHLYQDDNPIPPIIENDNEEIKLYTEKYFNFIIENKDRDVVFHSRRCKFPEEISNEFPSIKKEENFNIINEDERKLLYNYYKEHFNITLSGLDHNGLTDKLACSLYTGLRCLNFNIRNKIFVPPSIHLLLKKIFAYYIFFKRMQNDELTKIGSSPILEHLLEFFDHKVLNLEENLDFYHLGKFGYKDLRFVSYSGHDINFVGLIKNLLHLDTISHYINNINLYHKFLIVPFGSNFDFHLIKWPDGEYYVKMYLNGEEIFEKIRSHKFDDEIIYDKEKGIPYKTFKRIIKGRISEKYNECITTKKIKKNRE